MRNPIHGLVFLSIAAVGWPAGAVAGAAQDEVGRVHELTTTELTEERLIEILAGEPTGSEVPGTRGLSVALRQPICAKQRRETTRGIAPKPVSEVAAIKIHFAFNSAALLPEAKRNLDVLAGALQSPRLRMSCFRIEGHADSIGSEAYNDRLSQARADAVVRYLVDVSGLDTDRLLAAGLGERQPIADNATEEGRARNRRVQVANLGVGDDQG